MKNLFFSILVGLSIVLTFGACVSERGSQYDELLFELYSYGDDATLILEVDNLTSAETVQINYELAFAYNEYFVDTSYPGVYFFEIELDDLELEYTSGKFVIPRDLLKNINVYITKPITSHGKVIVSNGDVIGRDVKVK